MFFQIPSRVSERKNIAAEHFRWRAADIGFHGRGQFVRSSDEQVPERANAVQSSFDVSFGPRNLCRPARPGLGLKRCIRHVDRILA
jgi:hypothetical protein